jgi:hypothetical protein
MSQIAKALLNSIKCFRCLYLLLLFLILFPQMLMLLEFSYLLLLMLLLLLRQTKMFKITFFVLRRDSYRSIQTVLGRIQLFKMIRKFPFLSQVNHTKLWPFLVNKFECFFTYKNAIVKRNNYSLTSLKSLKDRFLFCLANSDFTLKLI